MRDSSRVEEVTAAPTDWSKRPSPSTFKSNFIWSLIGNAVFAASQWFTLILLTRISSAEVVGQFSLSLAIAIPLSFFANLHLRVLILTDVDGRHAIADINGLRLTASGAVLLMAIGTCAAAGYDAATSLIVFLMTAAQLFDCISDTYYGVLQRAERMARISISMMIRGPLSLVAVGAGVYFSGDLVWGAAGMTVVRLLTTVLYDGGPSTASLCFPGGSSGFALLKSRWSPGKYLNILLLTLPLGIISILVSFNANISKYFVESYLGRRELGIFALVSVLPSTGVMVMSAVGQVGMPRLVKAFAARAFGDFTALLFKLLGAGAFLGAAGLLVAAVAGGPILRLLYGARCAQYTELLLWLMAAGCGGYLAAILGYGMTAAGLFREQVPLFVFVTLATAVFNFFLVPRFGLRGAAFAMLFSVFVQLGCAGGLLYWTIRRSRIGVGGAINKNEQVPAVADA